MQNHFEIPQGEETILIEMTVKEALAISGEKFNQNHKLESSAMKKVKRTLESRFIKPAR